MDLLVGKQLVRRNDRGWNGSIRVIWDGTHAEAHEFVAEHRASFPRSLNVNVGYGPNGEMFLCSRFFNHDEYQRSSLAFSNLGWEGSDISGAKRRTPDSPLILATLYRVKANRPLPDVEPCHDCGGFHDGPCNAR